MRRPLFLARQAERPTGLFGRALGAIMARETRALNDEVLRRLAIAPGERILEIGFGHGRTLERAASGHAEAHFSGLDHARDMVDALAHRCARWVREGRLDLRMGSSELLPWPEESFDAAFAVHTLYFWGRPERDLAEIGRVLRRDGRFILAFRERTDETKASLPSEVYRLRSADDVAELLSEADFVPFLTRGPGRDVWIAEARRRGRPGS